MPFPFRPLPPPSDQFASAPVGNLSSSDYADAEDVTITNAPTRETAPVCSLADSEDVTVSNQVGYQSNDVPVDSGSDEAVSDEVSSEADFINLDEDQLEEVTANELDETVLSVDDDETTPNPGIGIDNEVSADKNEPDDDVSSSEETEAAKVPTT
ncbi:MAG: hypothetical protein JKY89_07085 [Immundisolibacteraceae bacterium]|nr:hypothetical protein [Immundisolibacteraceae bacterium]